MAWWYPRHFPDFPLPVTLKELIPDDEPSPEEITERLKAKHPEMAAAELDDSQGPAVPQTFTVFEDSPASTTVTREEAATPRRVAPVEVEMSSATEMELSSGSSGPPSSDDDDAEQTAPNDDDAAGNHGA